MFEACIRITEKEMTWSELKALCEGKKLQIITLALLDNEGGTMFDSSVVIPPDARCALHFKTAEADLASEATELVSESVGYIDAESREVTKLWHRKSNDIVPKVLAAPENQVHGIKSGGT
jgi:hypothetical protein